MTKYAVRFAQLPRLREQAAHRADVRAHGLPALLAGYHGAVPAQRRSEVAR